MAKRFYDLTVAGVKRSLPILDLDDTLAIAGFVLLGDVELTNACARALAQKVPRDAEIILTAETKGIPLAAELAHLLNMQRYVVARKSVKAYMENPVWVDDVSITTKGSQKLYLTDTDIELIKGRKVLLLDDVISTGGSMRAMEDLTKKVGGTIIAEAAVLAEGDASKRTDIIFLESLPLFKAQK